MTTILSTNIKEKFHLKKKLSSHFTDNLSKSHLRFSNFKQSRGKQEPTAQHLNNASEVTVFNLTSANEI